MKRLLAVAAIGVALCLAYVLSFFRPPYVVPLHASIRHDDFTFAVTSIVKKRVSGARDAYDVKIAVANQAKRVPYIWYDRIAYVRGGRGPRYYPATQREISIAPGDVANVSVEFILPATVAQPELHFWDGIYMGDAFNGAAYARAAVRL